MWSISYPSGTVRKNGEVVADFIEYEEFLRSGGSPDPLQDPQNPYPRIEVSAWQIRKALNQSALRQQVEEAVAASGNVEMQDGWTHAPTFWSDHPMTLNLGLALGKTRAEMQQLFELAASL